MLFVEKCIRKDVNDVYMNNSCRQITLEKNFYVWFNVDNEK